MSLTTGLVLVVCMNSSAGLRIADTRLGSDTRIQQPTRADHQCQIEEVSL